MPLDLTALKQKLNELSNKTRVSDVIWKPQEGTNVIRALPLASNPSNPFVEVYFHYLGGKTYVSPLTKGDPDPIAEFADKLRAGGGLTKEEWAETKKYVPKPRTYIPIVVRGKESEGVKLWGFGKTTYKELLGIIGDPEYGDITDVKSGRDIKVEFIPAEKSPTKFPKTDIRISPNQKPLTEDKDLLKVLTTVQPNIFDVYSILSYDELKEVLTKFLSPTKSDESTHTSTSEDMSTDDWDVPAVVVSSKEPKTSKNVDEEFDAIFNEK
jgi:hypothetical protein